MVWELGLPLILSLPLTPWVTVGSYLSSQSHDVLFFRNYLHTAFLGFSGTVYVMDQTECLVHNRCSIDVIFVFGFQGLIWICRCPMSANDLLQALSLLRVAKLVNSCQDFNWKKIIRSDKRTVAASGSTIVLGPQHVSLNTLKEPEEFSGSQIINLGSCLPCLYLYSCTVFSLNYLDQWPI